MGKENTLDKVPMTKSVEEYVTYPYIPMKRL